MKIIVTLLLILSGFGTIALGQTSREHRKSKEKAVKYHKIYVGLDTVFTPSGEAYCILKKVGNNFSVRNIANEEKIIVKRESYQGLDDAIDGLITGSFLQETYYMDIFFCTNESTCRNPILPQSPAWKSCN